VARTSSVAPVALSTYPGAAAADPSPTQATIRRRRLGLAGLAAAAACAAGIVVAQQASDAAATAAAPRFLWSTDAAAAARTMLQLPDRRSGAAERGPRAAAWMTPPQRGLDTPSDEAVAAEPSRITAPHVVIVQEARSESLNKPAQIDHASSARGIDEPTAAPLQRGSEAAHRPSDTAASPARALHSNGALSVLDGLPGSMEVDWQGSERREAESTQQQIKPTPLRANRSPRRSPLTWR
jgi:hypothetical protein